ncbi:hypothetical protein CRUP_013503 [Coryphaenoides rupestris]|nr:hypothetical protein CRUP_013503 [Coryphaenoides rupestris]
MFNGQEYPDGYEFVDEKDRCSVCSCYGGEVTCSRLPCYDLCRHPYTPAGQCCGECDRNHIGCLRYATCRSGSELCARRPEVLSLGYV